MMTKSEVQKRFLDYKELKDNYFQPDEYNVDNEKILVSYLYDLDFLENLYCKNRNCFNRVVQYLATKAQLLNPSPNVSLKHRQKLNQFLSWATWDNPDAQVQGYLLDMGASPNTMAYITYRDNKPPPSFERVATKIVQQANPTTIQKLLTPSLAPISIRDARLACTNAWAMIPGYKFWWYSDGYDRVTKSEVRENDTVLLTFPPHDEITPSLLTTLLEVKEPGEKKQKENIQESYFLVAAYCAVNYKRFLDDYGEKYNEDFVKLRDDAVTLINKLNPANLKRLADYCFDLSQNKWEKLFFIKNFGNIILPKLDPKIALNFVRQIINNEELSNYINTHWTGWNLSEEINRNLACQLFLPDRLLKKYTQLDILGGEVIYQIHQWEEQKKELKNFNSKEYNEIKNYDFKIHGKVDDACGRQALLAGVFLEDASLVLNLLQSGVNPNQVCFYSPQNFTWRRTCPLLEACNKDNYMLVAMLKRFGANEKFKIYTEQDEEKDTELVLGGRKYGEIIKETAIYIEFLNFFEKKVFTDPKRFSNKEYLQFLYKLAELNKKEPAKYQKFIAACDSLSPEAYNVLISDIDPFNTYFSAKIPADTKPAEILGIASEVTIAFRSIMDYFEEKEPETALSSPKFKDCNAMLDAVRNPEIEYSPNNEFWTIGGVIRSPIKYSYYQLSVAMAGLISKIPRDEATRKLIANIMGMDVLNRPAIIEEPKEKKAEKPPTEPKKTTEEVPGLTSDKTATQKEKSKIEVKAKPKTAPKKSTIKQLRALVRTILGVRRRQAAAEIATSASAGVTQTENTCEPSAPPAPTPYSAAALALPAASVPPVSAVSTEAVAVVEKKPLPLVRDPQKPLFQYQPPEGPKGAEMTVTLQTAYEDAVQHGASAAAKCIRELIEQNRTMGIPVPSTQTLDDIDVSIKSQLAAPQ